MNGYRSSTILASVMDLLACSELIGLSGVSDHSVLLRVLLPQDTEEYRDDMKSLKLWQLLLFGRKGCPRYLAFIGRSVRRLLYQQFSMPGHDPPHSDRQVYSAIYTRHSQLLINIVNRLRSHVQHQIQSDSNTVVYCLRSLISVLSKAEPSEAIAVMLRPENRPWNGLPPENLSSAIVKAADEAAQLYLRLHRQ
ncbi:hypothetical protein BJ165DRAFT_651811 [Panaeolus papilionaceus]|nr:hypothetical protein BJ165DRAFT_651811 [Panaeolus papilionaceus]